MRHRVAVTGISCISSFGIGHRPFVDALSEGRSGIRPITAFDTSSCRSHCAATIDGFDPAAFISPLKLRRVDLVGRLALVCARLLIEDAALTPGAEGTDDVGVALGTLTAGMDSTVEYLQGLTKHGPAGAPALIFSNTVSNAPASLCAIEHGLRGPNVTFNRRRHGMVLGEAGVLLLLEAGDGAAARGARVYGEILGIGMTASRAELN